MLQKWFVIAIKYIFAYRAVPSVCSLTNLKRFYV